jgi:hypothetical protein
VWTWVGEVVIGPLSRRGAETEIETEGKLVAPGDGGGVLEEEGKRWRPLGAPEEVELVLLRLRLRYSTIRSWKEGLTGEYSAGEILLRSSADLDHPFFEMFLRSPREVGGLELGPRSLDSSTDPCVLVERSRTDLGKMRNRQVDRKDYPPTCTSSMIIKNWTWICGARNLVFSAT